jgi:ATP-dependent Lon protease
MRTITGSRRSSAAFLEYLAVRKLNPSGKSPILCFVGPPGVGKTSLGQSIAKATGRKFVRVSLGGVTTKPRSAAIGAPISARCRATSSRACARSTRRNCVLMLDEVDKLGAGGFHGDPGSALLEVLDPEQNSTFRDNYLAVPFDLSRRDVHLHGERARYDSRPAARQDGSDPASRATPRRRSCRSPGVICSRGSSSRRA